MSKVVPSEREIYVLSPDGRKHEYYFTKDTTVTRASLAATFEDLRKDQKVTVTANRRGKRLDPVVVAID